MLTRPIQTILIFHVSILIILDLIGFFNPKFQSFLFFFAQYKQSVSIEGRIISDIENIGKNKRFILKASKVNNIPVSEKILVYIPMGRDVFYGYEIALEGKIELPQKAVFPLVFDYRKYLARENIYTVLKAYSFEFIKESPNPIQKFALTVRKDMIFKIDNFFKKPYSDILKSVIIGDKSTLENHIKTVFTDAGLMHILVVSGLHIGFVGFLFLIVFKFIGLPLKKAFLLTIPFIFLYVLITGSNPPALRAGIMFSCILISLSLDREPLIYNSLALSALIILILSPQALFTASFQMSYMATVGIIYFHDKISILFKEIKNFYIRAILSALSISISAQIFLIPLCAYYFGKISLIAAISNLIIVPILSLIPPFAFTFYILTFISQNLSQIITYPLSWLIKMILFITDFLGGLKYVSINMPKPNIVQIFLFLIGIFYTVEFFRDKKRFVFALLIIVIGFSYSFALNVYKKHKDLEFIYENSNMSVLQIRRNGKNTFIISQKTNRYYDKLYIFSFKQFLSFSNIKSPSIYAFGFNDIQKLNADLGTQVNDGKDL